MGIANGMALLTIVLVLLSYVIEGTRAQVAGRKKANNNTRKMGQSKEAGKAKRMANLRI